MKNERWKIVATHYRLPSTDYRL